VSYEENEGLRIQTQVPSRVVKNKIEHFEKFLEYQNYLLNRNIWGCIQNSSYSSLQMGSIS
jgi:hypothetical protein